MTKTRKQALGLVLFFIPCAVVFVYLLGLSGTSFPLGPSPYRIQAVVPDAVAVADGADVRQAGVKVGQVSGLRGSGNATILGLDIDREHAPVYYDARVLVRSKSVVGENYVEIKPGQPAAGALPDNAVLSIEHAQEATQIDQILSTLDPAHRRDLQRILDALGQGLDGQGSNLSRLVGATTSAIENGSTVSQVLAKDRTQLAALVDSFGQVTRALGERKLAIEQLSHSAKTTAEAVASRDQALGASLRALPPLLRQASGTADHLQTFSTSATPVIANLRSATEDLVPAFRELGPAAKSARAAVSELGGFAADALPTIKRLRPFSAVGTDFVPALASVLRQANPLVAYLRPYARELSSFLALSGAVTSFQDEIGHVARILPLVSLSNVPGTLTPAQIKLYDSLVKGLGLGFLDTRGSNAYPAPGDAGGSTPWKGKVPRLERDPPYGG